jgi:lysozyme family protein
MGGHVLKTGNGNPESHALWPDYFDLLMELEGESFENDPADAGGATKFGIDQRSHPGVDIRSLTRCQAERIHLGEFLASAASKLPAPLSFVFFDFAMNAGESASARALQRAISHSPADGRIGPLTLGTLHGFLSQPGSAALLLARFSDKRELHYKNLAFCTPRLTRFLRGWLRRTLIVHNWAAARLNDREAA